MHRLYDERRGQPLAGGFGATVLHHVRRDVAPVDVEAGAEVRDQHAPGATGDVERRLTGTLDVALEVRDLVRAEVVVELRPPGRDEPVMPRLGITLLLQLVAHEPSGYAAARRSSHARAAALRLSGSVRVVRVEIFYCPV